MSTQVDFTTYRFGYEYDFLYTNRGFLGVLFDLKYTNVDLDLRSPIHTEFVSAAAPIPTIGVVGRVFPAKNFAINGELSFFRTAVTLAEQFEGDASYTDIDINGTVNFNKNFGAQIGWKRISVFYDIDLDVGTLKFNGFYYGGVVRF